MRLIFAGTPTSAIPSLEAIAASHHDVVAVITRPDAARGRGRELESSPVALRAEDLGLRVLKPETPRGGELERELRELSPECCPIVAYGGLIPPELLRVPTHGWVNLHFSLLPAWRGAAPVHHAIAHGDDMTGATTFRLTEGLDSGPVYGTVTESIGDRDTTGDVLSRLAQAGAELLVHTLNGIERGDLAPQEQPADGVTWAPKVTPAEARVIWNEPALAVDRRIRSNTPSPGAWTEWAGRRIGVLPLASAAAQRSEALLRAGEVRVTKHEVWVGTGSGDVLLGDVRPAGKGTMAASDWARGARLNDGDILT